MMTLLRRWKQAIEFGFGLSRHFYTISLDGFIFHPTLQAAADSVNEWSATAPRSAFPTFPTLTNKTTSGLPNSCYRCCFWERREETFKKRIFDSFLFCFHFHSRRKLTWPISNERRNRRRRVPAHVREKSTELLCSPCQYCNKLWRPRLYDQERKTRETFTRQLMAGVDWSCVWECQTAMCVLS